MLSPEMTPTLTSSFFKDDFSFSVYVEDMTSCGKAGRSRGRWFGRGVYSCFLARQMEADGSFCRISSGWRASAQWRYAYSLCRAYERWWWRKALPRSVRRDVMAFGATFCPGLSITPAPRYKPQLRLRLPITISQIYFHFPLHFEVGTRWKAMEGPKSV